jgi:hypothetical protein
VKYYFLSKDFEHPAKDEPEIVDGDWLTQRIIWTEQTLVELQAVSNMVMTGLKRIQQWKASKEEGNESLTKLEHSPKCFTLHITNEEGARMWYKKYVKFLVDFETELMRIHDKARKRGAKIENVVFSGVIPVITYHSLKDSE